MNRVVIALGSNISPEIHIQHAIGRIQHRFGILKTSEFVWTKPVGNIEQPDFLNGVVLIQTEMGMSELKSWLSDQEGALKSWHGSFSISDVKFIEPGGPFRLVASDGRRGEILISRVSAGSHQAGN